MKHPSDRLAFVGRLADGRGFDAYVASETDIARPLAESGPRSNLEEALEWARERSDRVVLTYGFSQESEFSAGAVYFSGLDPDNPLPEWPPSEEQRRTIDSDVAHAVEASTGSKGRMGVVEPEVRQ